MAASRDRISLLPDELLHHILSFLSIQAAIKTCLLSKRWKPLWTSIPTLTFDYASYSLKSIHNNDSKRSSFRHFILRVLSRRSPLSILKKLTYSLPTSNIMFWARNNEKEDGFVLELLFNLAASHHVEELCINGRYMPFPTWRSCLSTCRSLKLTGCLEGTWESPMASQFLKSLEIENYRSNKVMKLEGDMFRSCPLLERLVLRGPCFARAKIAAPKLEYLEMGFRFRHYVYGDLFPEIVLCTPKLAFIKFYDLIPSVVFTDDCFLSQHKIEFSFFHSTFLLISEQVREKHKVAERLRGLLNLLQNANSLTLNPIALEVYLYIHINIYIYIHVCFFFLFKVLIVVLV